MPVEAPNLEAAAHGYSQELPEILDVVHLGLGDDGHTASLVPGDPVLDVDDRAVAITEPYRGHRRMTLTYPALGRAVAIVWIVAGTDKAPMVERLLAADPTIPAGRVPQDRAILVTNSI
jgi:6-phosphogluconolactonase/glucosamine-6-phosphate isomerase/deaminase